MILEPKNDPTKQAHQARFMITDVDVDAIVQEWPDEWRDPLAKLLPEEQNQEYPPVNQDNGQGNDGGNGKDNQS